MDITTFKASLHDAIPPAGLNACLEALWREGKGDWDAAHKLVQDEKTPQPAAVHAYLHRVEGDLSNAAYWYRRAGREAETGELADEWTALAGEFLGG